jgi:hypothetical protein
MKFVETKKVRNQIFHSSSFVEVVGSGIQNQGSGIRDPGGMDKNQDPG